MLPDEITKCPHCGSNEGYYFTLKIKHTQSKGFGNNPDHDTASEGEALKDHSACRCESCNKVIKQDA